MKKVLFILACAPAWVLADVTLYGRVSAAVEVDQFPSPTQVQPSTLSVQDYGSYFGIRGTDLVYGQTAAIWQIEQFIDISAGEAYQKTTGSNWVPNHPGATSSGSPTIGQNVLASSDSYIGLTGDWGRIRLGNLSNTFRTNTGAVDIFNGANANVFGTYDRFLAVRAETVRYDTPSWGNFAMAMYYSFNQDGNYNTGGANGNGMDQTGDMNGFNNAPVFGWGLFYNPGNFSVSWNNQVAMNTGIYQTIENGGSSAGGQTDSNGNVIVPVQFGINAWVSRLEVGYNDPDSWFAGIGGQLSQGYAYFSAPGNGNMQNLWLAPGAAGSLASNYYVCSTAAGWCNLTTAVLGSAEIGAAVGWHIENWTPKLGYVYGSNLMNSGSPWDLLGGRNQLAGTGYQQIIAELDWNITPRTIAFVNAGQQWWGTTAQSLVKASQAPVTPSISQAGGSIWINNFTTAMGFTHTF